MPQLPSLATLVQRGQWPADISALPLFLTEPELGHILDRSVRTLQRDRYKKRGIPHTKFGRKVLYSREAVLSFLGGRV